MMLMGNNLEIPFGGWNSYIILHENDKTYEYNHFMEYWEDRDTHKFYRWLNSKDMKDIKEHKEFYFNSLD